MLFGALDLTPFPDGLWVPLEASSSVLPAGALPFDPPCFRESGPDLKCLDFLF